MSLRMRRCYKHHTARHCNSVLSTLHFYALVSIISEVGGIRDIPVTSSFCLPQFPTHSDNGKYPSRMSVSKRTVLHFYRRVGGWDADPSGCAV